MFSPFGGSVSDSAHLEVRFQSQPIWRWGFSLSPFGGGVSVSAHLEVGFQSQPIWRLCFRLWPIWRQCLAQPVGGWVGPTWVTPVCGLFFSWQWHSACWWLWVSPWGVLVVNSFPAGYFYPFWWLQPFWGFCVAC